MGIYIFTLTSLPLCLIGLARSVLEARGARAAKRADALVLGERSSDPLSKGSGVKARGSAAGGSSRERMAGRFAANDGVADQVVVSIERVVRVDQLELDRIELGEPGDQKGDAERVGGGSGGGGGGGGDGGGLRSGSVSEVSFGE